MAMDPDPDAIEPGTPGTPDPGGAADSPELQEPAGRTARKRGFVSRWVESRAEKAIRSAVSSGADHIEERATRVVSSVYEEKASDLEDRAVRALRRAIHEETERIQATIEHAVEVKRREVRLSLLVLVGAAIVYLVLYWLTQPTPVA